MPPLGWDLGSFPLFASKPLSCNRAAPDEPLEQLLDVGDGAIQIWGAVVGPHSIPSSWARDGDGEQSWAHGTNEDNGPGYGSGTVGPGVLASPCGVSIREGEVGGSWGTHPHLLWVHTTQRHEAPGQMHPPSLCKYGGVPPQIPPHG